MRKSLIVPILGVAIAFCLCLCQVQDAAAAERALVLRQSLEDQKAAVAVEAYLEGDTLEVKVSARMLDSKPKIYDVILIGPKLGRLNPVTIDKVYAEVEEEEPYPVVKRGGGLVTFGKTKSYKQRKARTVRKLAVFRIPADQIVPGGRYELQVKIEKFQGKGKLRVYDFDLKNLSMLVHKR